MNIAVFSDLHGRILLCFLLCVRWQQETGERIDAISQAGDLDAYPSEAGMDRATIRFGRRDPTEFGFATDFASYHEEVARALTRTQCPLIFVRGNHEDHHWLDTLERQSDDAVFPVDVYRRVWCLKTGVPYTVLQNLPVHAEAQNVFGSCFFRERVPACVGSCTAAARRRPALPPPQAFSLSGELPASLRTLLAAFRSRSTFWPQSAF
jgi:hypothetical protein